MRTQPDKQASRLYTERISGLSVNPEGPVRRRPTVLVVEDEEAVRELIEIALSKDGLNILLAESAEQALAIATTLDGTIEVLLTDLTLPSMDGHSLAKVLTSRGQVRHVIYMSGLVETVSADDAGQSSHYLTKPFKMAALAQVVQDVLGCEAPPPHIAEPTSSPYAADPTGLG